MKGCKIMFTKWTKMQMKLFNKYNHYVTFVERYEHFYKELLCLKGELTFLPLGLIPFVSNKGILWTLIIFSILLLIYIGELILFMHTQHIRKKQSRQS